MKNLKSNNTMNKTLCPKCEMVEVESIFTLCDSCVNEQTENREKEMIKETEKLIESICRVLLDKTELDYVNFRTHNKRLSIIQSACKIAIQTLTFTKAEFEKSIGALILDGAFESENDAGASMLKLYIRDYQKQIDYINKTYLS